jgi:hypothetical protein
MQERENKLSHILDVPTRVLTSTSQNNLAALDVLLRKVEMSERDERAFRSSRKPIHRGSSTLSSIAPDPSTPVYPLNLCIAGSKYTRTRYTINHRNQFIKLYRIVHVLIFFIHRATGSWTRTVRSWIDVYFYSSVVCYAMR